MDMNVNSQFIIEQRKSKAWSQQHLSDVSNLSLRTIQRVESSGKASNETIRSIASAFEVDINSLLLSQSANRSKFSLGWKSGSIAATASAISLFLIATVSTSAASGISIDADEVVNINEFTDNYNGSVSISIPQGKELVLNAKEMWTSGDSNFVKGGVEIISGVMKIKFEDGTLIKIGDTYLVNTDSAIVSKQGLE